MFASIREKINTLDIFKVVYDDITDIEEIAGYCVRFEKVLVFGTGGSSLGAKALIEFKAAHDGRCSKVHFIENVDSRHFINTISMCDPKRTGIIVISKSGRTTETLMLLGTLIERWSDFDFKNNAIVITEDSDQNDLRIIAQERGAKIIDHNKNIGGRFSVFSVVGLLPAAIGGVDIRSFLEGAKQFISEFNQESCSLYRGIEKMAQLIKDGVNEHVIFSYSDFMSGFGKWSIQLISESLGKNSDCGVTPVSAVGTVDQHSMLQLFLAGPDNKYYTVITQNSHIETERINIKGSAVMDRLNGHSIPELMIAHQKATIDVLKEKAHVRVVEFNELNEYALGYLMMMFVIETVGVADILGINPFDQPAVEKSKKIAMDYLEEMR